MPETEIVSQTAPVTADADAFADFVVAQAIAFHEERRAAGEPKRPYRFGIIGHTGTGKSTLAAKVMAKLRRLGMVGATDVIVELDDYIIDDCTLPGPDWPGYRHGDFLVDILFPISQCQYPISWPGYDYFTNEQTEDRVLGADVIYDADGVPLDDTLPDVILFEGLALDRYEMRPFFEGYGGVLYDLERAIDDGRERSRRVRGDNAHDEYWDPVTGVWAINSRRYWYEYLRQDQSHVIIWYDSAKARAAALRNAALGRRIRKEFARGGEGWFGNMPALAVRDCNYWYSRSGYLA